MSKIYIITNFNFFTQIKTALIAAGPVETSESYAKAILREPLRIQRIFQRMQERGYDIFLIIPDETRFTNLLTGRALVERYFDIGYGQERTFLNTDHIFSFNPDEMATNNTNHYKIKLIQKILTIYNAEHPENSITSEMLKERVVVIDEDEEFLNHIEKLGLKTHCIEPHPVNYDLRILEEELGIILPKYNPEQIDALSRSTAEYKKTSTQPSLQ